jgi:hypothetical protein
VNQISSKFQDPIFIVIKLNPLPQKNSGRTFDRVVLELVLCFFLAILGIRRKLIVWANHSVKSAQTFRTPSSLTVNWTHLLQKFMDEPSKKCGLSEFVFRTRDFWPRRNSGLFELTTESNELKLSGFYLYCQPIEPITSKKIRTNFWLCGVGVSFVFFGSDFWHWEKSGSLSEPLSQISSNFQDSILVISRFNSFPQKESGQTLEKVWS